MTPSTILSRLRADHRRVLRDLDALEGATPALRGGSGVGARGRRGAPDWSSLRLLLQRLERQFATHMVAEERSLFPALEEVMPETRTPIAPLRDEHDDLRALLGGLARLVAAPPAAGRDEQVVVLWRDFAELLRIHVRKEEAVVFSIAGHVLPPRELARVEALRFPPREAARRRTHPIQRKDVLP